MFIIGKYSSIGRAVGCGPKGWGFKPLYLPNIWLLKLNKSLSCNSYNSLKWLILLNSNLLSFWSYSFLFFYSKLNNSIKFFTPIGTLLHKLSSNNFSLFTKAFFLNFKTVSRVNLPKVKSHTTANYSNKPLLVETGMPNERYLLYIFKSFIKTNLNTFNCRTVAHASFKFYYLGTSRRGYLVVSLIKVFQRLKDFYYLLFNLFFYKIELLYLGNSFFKKEILALNWLLFSSFNYLWRYVKPFIFLKPNNINIYGDFIFYKVRLMGINISIIFDVVYHSKTLHYVRRAGFYSIGVVPTTYKLGCVNFALPAASNSIISHLFSVRFILLIRKQAYAFNYDNFIKAWAFRSLI